MYCVIRTIKIIEPVKPHTRQTDVFLFETQEEADKIMETIPDHKHISYLMLEPSSHEDLLSVLPHVR
jgi:hypothetical protein